MKNQKLALSLVTFISLTQLAQALDLRVVRNYKDAENVAIWEKVKPDVVPEVLMGTENVNDPSRAYDIRGNFPKTFMQEDLFVVCHDDCSKKEILNINNKEIKNSNDWNVVEQSTVYFWLNRYFAFLEQELNFRPEHHLRVMTNRNYVEPTNGDAVKNNAFFMPSDMSLSFLPASKSVLFKLLQGKINRSGFDPSVIVHEASHYIFHHLFPDAVNEEIGGLNEGFADYFANAFLNSPKVGLVMLRGKAMRDSSNPKTSGGEYKTYKPSMEVHDLGERVTYALWAARSLSENKREVDRMVIDAVIDLARNPYASVHEFKDKMLERLPSIVPASNLAKVEQVFATIFWGQASKVANTNFLNAKIDSRDFVAFKNRQIISPEIAKATGLPGLTESIIGNISTVTLSKTQAAVLLSNETSSTSTPYWVVVDKEYNNILAAYALDNRLVKDSKEIEEISPLLEQAKSNSNTVSSFSKTTQGLVDLSEGKGELGFFYKVKGQKVVSATHTLNGMAYQGNEVAFSPKRKLLTGMILGSLIGGLPPIKQVTLLTIPEKRLATPQVNGQSVIGYRLTLESGIETEVSINSIYLK